MAIGPDLSALRDVVSPKVLHAAKEASRVLTELGIRHALVGGLAVGAYGYPRATKDVDFLVGDEAFEHHGGGVVTFASGVPVLVDGIMIDPILPRPEEGYLQDSLAQATTSECVPVAPPEVLVHMKLTSPRQKDAADLVELFKAGLDAATVSVYLKAKAPHLLDKFAALVAQAAKEIKEEGE